MSHEGRLLFFIFFSFDELLPDQWQPLYKAREDRQNLQR
jgi:hypothetical protein